METKRRFEV